MIPQLPHPDSSDEEDLDAFEPSKSQRKRDADEIRDFAKLLTTLPASKLKRLELPSNIEDAIKKCPPVSTRGAHKRHLQFISKLIRKTEDVEGIKARLENPVSATKKKSDHELMRDSLINSFADHVDELREHYPEVNLQTVRQLLRQINAAPEESVSDEEDSTEVQSLRKKAEKARKSLLQILRN